MCYYSRAMQRDQYRDVEVGEDLTLRHDRSGHAMATGKDGLAVCVMNNTTIHLEKFELCPEFAWNHAHWTVRKTFAPLVGKALSAKFVEYHSGPYDRAGYSSDAIEVDGVRFHLAWMKEGTKCYVGAERITLETKLGVDDPSIVHDHKPIDEMPTHGHVVAVINGLCSITR